MDRHGERGQTITFWVFAVILALGLSFFVMNYGNTIRWHIRAQNAADTAALASIAADANINNQQTIALYALTISEFRVRSIHNSMVNAGNSKGGCDSSQDDSGYDCDNAYDQEPAAYDAAVENYATALRNFEQLKSAPAPTGASPAPLPNGSPAPEPAAPANSSTKPAFDMVASNQNCWDTGVGKPVFDCAFGYGADLSKTGFGTNEYAETVACRKVSPTAGASFSLTNANFKAEGRSAATLRAVSSGDFKPGLAPDTSQTLTPATSLNPTPSPVAFQPVESCPGKLDGGGCDLSQGWRATTPYVVDYSGLTVNATFYEPALTIPLDSSAQFALFERCSIG